MGTLVKLVDDVNLWWRGEDGASVLHILLSDGDVPADVLGDVRTKQNTISVYALEDDGPSVERIVAAVEFGRTLGDKKKLMKPRACLVFDEEIPRSCGIELVGTQGKTEDRFVNTRHRDLAELTGKKLVALANRLLLDVEPQTIDLPELLTELRTAENNQDINSKRINAMVREQMAALA